MELSGYLRAIRKSWWIVLLMLLVGGGGGALISARATPLYEARITFYVAISNVDSQTAIGAEQFAEDRANTYAQLLSSDKLARSVLSTTGLKLSTGDVLNRISGSAKLNTVLINASVRDSSVPRLVTIANAVAREFPAMVQQLDNSASTKSGVHLEVVSGPSVGSSPVSPRTKLNMSLGAAAGLVFGLLIAALREVLDVSIGSSAALEEFGGAAVIGAIGRDPVVRRAPLLVGEQAQSRRAEAFRQLRTNMQFINAAYRATVVVVTSAVVGEGKSLTAANLAIVVAETGASVLLIDADMRRPTIASYLEIEGQVGLSNVLAGQVLIEEATQTWGDQGLTVLPCGSIPPNPAELLGSESMRRLVDFARNRFDMVIMDSPPLVPVTDAAVLVAYADGVLVVFRHGKTRRGHLATSLAALRAVNARLLGFVMNMTSTHASDRSGYYYQRPIKEADAPTGFARGWLGANSPAPDERPSVDVAPDEVTITPKTQAMRRPRPRPKLKTEAGTGSSVAPPEASREAST